MRYFACGRDLSQDPMDEPLPDRVVHGADVFCVIGAIAGG
jgi:sulfur-carrier protein